MARLSYGAAFTRAVIPAVKPLGQELLATGTPGPPPREAMSHAEL